MRAEDDEVSAGWKLCRHSFESVFVLRATLQREPSKNENSTDGGPEIEFFRSDAGDVAERRSSIDEI